MKFPGIRTVFAVVVCATLAGPSVLTAAADDQKETEQVDRNFPMQPGGQLKLKNFSGKIHITGSNRTNVVVHAVRRATRDRLDHIRLEIQASASEISIDANKKDDGWREQKDNVVETEFEIEVPERIALDVHAFSSDMHLESIDGRQKLYSFSGTIRIDDATGPLEAETFSGEIKADLDRAGAAPDVEMKTFSGDIEVKLSSSPRGRVDFSSFSGSLDSNVPMLYRTGNRRHVRGELGGGGTNELRFHTFSGDVRIK
jgi:DUF4097 and DUF4098 domain-containing protein YvlB